MAKTYEKSEMTPELLHLNLQYFFDAPAREFRMAIEEIVLSTGRNEVRWLGIMNHWHGFMMNPPVESTALRDIAENLAKTATENNIETVLDIFDGLATFMSTTVVSDDEKIKEIIATVDRLNKSIYDGTAMEEIEGKRTLLEEKRATEEKAEADFMRSKTSEQEAIADLQVQISELTNTIEELTESNESANREKTDEAKVRIRGALSAATRIADRMENEVTRAREEEELRKQEELIRRADEKLEFEQEWGVYAGKYTSKDDTPTADLFKKFLIDEKGLTPNQVDEIAVSAAFYGGELGNFLEFDEELNRVKDIKSD